MVSFLCDTSGIERDRFGRSKNLPPLKHSWEEAYERDRAAAEVREAWERSRREREDEHEAWRQQQQREFYATWERRQHAAALGLGAPDVRQSLTKPKPSAPTAKDQNFYRICVHEAGHALCAHLMGRPLAEICVETDMYKGRLRGGRVWAIPDDAKDRSSQALMILEAGRAGELVALGDVFEAGLELDEEVGRELADKLADGDKDRADKLIREARAVAHSVLKPHARAIRKLAFRLAAKKRLLLDLADKEIVEVLAECKPDKRSDASVGNATSERTEPSQQASTTRSYTIDNHPPEMRWLFETVHHQTGGHIVTDSFRSIQGVTS